ncbi:MAG: hypothetical protein CL856_05425 [Cryomorphaceae bacterium]|nr:hypothetical protein [Cryomorphaceae bacterium]
MNDPNFMRYLLVLLFQLFLFHSSIAQSLYKIDLKTDTKIAASVISLVLINEPFRSKIEGFSSDDLSSLTTENIANWDRYGLGLWSPKAAMRSDVFAFSSLLMSSSVALIPSIRSKKWNSSIPTISMLLEVNALTYFSTQLVKNISSRSRPYVYSSNVPLDIRMSRDARRSFFSGHTSLSASNTFFAARVYSDIYPNSKLKPLVWTIAAVLPALTGYNRVLSGKHFLSDVIIGYSCGALFGYTVPLIHKD